MIRGSVYSNDYKVAASARRRLLTAADGDYDLEPVTMGEHRFTATAARDNLAVALERDALARELELLDQLLAVDRAREFTGLAVDRDGNHWGKSLEKH
jgi:hypothetical protein